MLESLLETTSPVKSKKELGRVFVFHDSCCGIWLAQIIKVLLPLGRWMVVSNIQCVRPSKCKLANNFNYTGNYILLHITSNMQMIPRNQVWFQHHNCIRSRKLNVHGTFPWPWSRLQPLYHSPGLHDDRVSDRQPAENHPQPTLNLDLAKTVQVSPGQNGNDCAQQDG